MLKISIITVCYNSANTIGDTINSVASQTYSNKEHIIVDGSSKDATMEMVRSSPSVSRFLSEPDKGIYDAMNKGIKLATGEVVGILNSDDFYVDDTILTQVAEVFANPQIDACYADLIYVDEQDTNKVVRYWKSRNFAPGLFKRGWMPAHPTFFVRREIYEELGDFDLSFRFQADFELTMRFLEIYRITAMYIPKIFIKMRVGGVSNNSIINIVKGNIEAYKACNKNHLSILPIFNIMKRASRIPQFFLRPTEF
jgi:glycosyltransferase involved in cell wall biosynthesis